MNFIQRAKDILLSPKSEWVIIKDEETTIADMLKNYVIILAAIPAVAGFIGYAIFGMNLGIVSFKMPIGTAVSWAVITFVFSIISVFIIAFIIDALAPTFGASKNIVSSTKIVVYSYTASWVGGIFHLIPALAMLSAVAGIYSLVLMYMGLQTVKEVPQEKMIGYFVTVLIISIILYVILGVITSALTVNAVIPYKY